ncbi:FecR domain-containing protein [Roseomonas sp. GC11]|uniref:FecR family protein n=1 Tax=Roseomonas sp. GC11 TaxID=2950546 RepID=UPI00210E158A|nr:FecR domain-containing protein [Roseomonas sp. GC11]MCQ4160515.1 FecR domain-containing protein [Roseomonas sp. GC11]
MTEPSAAMVRRAAEWHALLASGEATAAQQARCRAWQAEHPGHTEAFRRMETILGRFEGLPAEPARRALQAAPRRRRLAWGGAACLLALAALLPDWPWWLADHRAETGEIRSLTLPDGSRVTLDTGSAITLRFDAGMRRVILVRGALLLEVAPDPGRPLVVETPEGRLRVLGTRFAVRRGVAETGIVVEESAVRACPGAVEEGAACITLRQGQAGRLAGHRAAGPFPAPPGATAWAQGLLVAEDRPLAEVLDELARYRPGLLRYDRAALEGLRLSGVLPLRKTETALEAIAAALPVEIRHEAPFILSVRRL